MRGKGREEGREGRGGEGGERREGKRKVSTLSSTYPSLSLLILKDHFDMGEGRVGEERGRKEGRGEKVSTLSSSTFGLGSILL